MYILIRTSRKFIIPEGINRNYWSATTESNNPTNAWNVNLSNGNTNNNTKSNPNNTVRCVRALPPPALSLFFMTTIFTLEKLYRAYNECRKGKKNSINAVLFEIDREKNLLNLLNELQDRTYTISCSICFVVTHPAPREIFAASFRDRVVHHLLHNEIHEIFEPTFIAHSYANRKGKGTHRAVHQLRKNMQEVKRKTGGGWCLKLDVQGFFRSIDKDILYTLLSQKIMSSRNCGGGGRFSGRVTYGMARRSSLVV
jgi:RNA-directed DNA polymerase